MSSPVPGSLGGRLAPLVVLAPALMSLAVIPFGEHLAARNINVGLLMVFAFGSINVMAIMLGGWVFAEQVRRSSPPPGWSPRTSPTKSPCCWSSSP